MFSHSEIAASRSLKFLAPVAITLAVPWLGLVSPNAQAKGKRAVPVAPKETAAQVAGRKVIAQSYDVYNQAVLRKDLAGLVAFLAPDYEHYTVARLRQDRVGFENLNRKMFGLPVQVVNLITKIQKIEWRGVDAVVYCDMGVTTKSTAGNAMPFTVRWKERDYWSPTTQGWKLRQATELKFF